MYLGVGYLGSVVVMYLGVGYLGTVVDMYLGVGYLGTATEVWILGRGVVYLCLRPTVAYIRTGVWTLGSLGVYVPRLLMGGLPRPV